ncbi:hypothetical protein B0H14DRAFT_2590009 [Mycena olivaceomarginata]|nr:hypothetical protein B0H14DRAFT_2590009 [Mycena olivaceomarginata]
MGLEPTTQIDDKPAVCRQRWPVRRQLQVWAWINQRTIRILEKLRHVGFRLALDNAAACAQKLETDLNLPLVVDSRTVRQRRTNSGQEHDPDERLAVAHSVIQLSERKRSRNNTIYNHGAAE